MFVMNASYVFRAKPALTESIREWRVDMAGFEDEVLGPYLWTNHEAFRSDAVVGIKLLFVARIRELASEFGAPVLATLPLTEASFDRFWTVDVFKAPGQVAVQVYRDLQATGGLVDADPETVQRIETSIADALRGAGHPKNDCS